MMMLIVCKSMLINEFTGLNIMFMIFVLLGLWISQFETPLSPAPSFPPATSETFDILNFLLGREGCSNAHLSVIPGNQMHRPVTFAKLKHHSQASALRFHFHARKFFHYINNCQLNIEMASFPFAGLFS